MAYRIKTVAELTGIPRNTLIAWERRYGLVTPERNDSGYRSYTDEDVALLQRIKAVVDNGYRISEAIELVRRDQRGDADAGPADALAEVRVEMLDALLHFDRVGADRAARRLVTVPFETSTDEVFLPLLRDVGTRWERDEITVVQEHYAAAYCREHLVAMMRSLETGNPGAPEAILATPAGERHEFGLLGAALRLAIRGYRVTYLGSDVPTDELCDLIRDRSPSVLCLSFVVPREPAEILEYTRRLAACGPRTTLLVGGEATTSLAAHSSERIQYALRLEDLDLNGVAGRV